MNEEQEEIVRIHMRDNYDVAPWEWDEEELKQAIYDLIISNKKKDEED